MEVETEVGRRPLNLQGRFMSQKHEPYVRFTDKFPHFGSPSAAVSRQMFRRPRPRPQPASAPAAASHETTSANAQGSNGGVSLGGPAAAAHSSAAHNNNY